MTPLVFVLEALTAYRLTSLVVTDQITMPLRARVARRHRPSSPLVMFVHCGRCVGWWVSGLVVAAGWALAVAPGGRWFVVGWPACAGAVNVLFRLEQ